MMHHIFPELCVVGPRLLIYQSRINFANIVNRAGCQVTTLPIAKTKANVQYYIHADSTVHANANAKLPSLMRRRRPARSASRAGTLTNPYEEREKELWPVADCIRHRTTWTCLPHSTGTPRLPFEQARKAGGLLWRGSLGTPRNHPRTGCKRNHRRPRSKYTRHVHKRHDRPSRSRSEPFRPRAKNPNKQSGPRQYEYPSRQYPEAGSSIIEPYRSIRGTCVHYY
jgi:hypothetical protein